MSLPRFHCPGLLTAPGETIVLPEAAAHHAVRVLRMRAGDALTVFNGSGGAWQGCIVEAGRQVSVRIEAAAAAVAEPALHITLVQALPSGDKMDWVVQKAVELGVARIQPVAARRCVVKLAGERAVKRVAHWQEVAVGACEQSGRDVVPVVLPILELPEYLAQARGGEARCFLLAPGGGQRLRDMSAPAGEVCILIGPEGGFAPEEETAAKSAGFSPLLLGPRILRTETAGLAAIAAMMTLWGDI